MTQDPNANLVANGAAPGQERMPDATAGPDRIAAAREAFQFYPDEVLAALEPGVSFDRSSLICALERRSRLLARLTALRAADAAIGPAEEGALHDEVAAILALLWSSSNNAPPLLLAALEAVTERALVDSARVSNAVRSLAPPVAAPRAPAAHRPTPRAVDLDPPLKPTLSKKRSAPPLSRPRRMTRARVIALGCALAAALWALHSQWPAEPPVTSETGSTSTGSTGAGESDATGAVDS